MALSRDIREKVVKAIASGMSRRQAAARFDIGPPQSQRRVRQTISLPIFRAAGRKGAFGVANCSRRLNCAATPAVFPIWSGS